jgi:pimeloyl-ACP methyl ester carboxylesterase
MRIYLLISLVFFASFQNVKCQHLISEEKFIPVNGIDQWITIQGDRSKPVILFLHGGPGSPISPFSEAVYHDWEKDFIIVQWDQRGTAKTFGLHAPEELDPVYLKANPLTLEQMTADGIAVSEYLLSHLGKQKLILFGSSWGSVLGISMAVRRPDLFYAYVGHSQIVEPVDNYPLIYDKVLGLATHDSDENSVAILQKLGPPPYDTARNYGQLLRIIKKYEKKNSVAAPESFWKMSDLYNNAKDEKDREEGDDYSFVNYTGDKKLQVAGMMAGIHFSRSALNFNTPVYFIQGEEDILTAKDYTKPYYDRINAPVKKYILVPGAAHGFNQAVVDAQYKTMLEIKSANKLP